MSTSSNTITSSTPTPISDPAARTRVKVLETAVDHAIVIAKIVKDNTEVNPVLGPLKASMGRLIAVLEAIRVMALYTDNSRH
jgi:hypothetical protein